MGGFRAGTALGLDRSERQLVTPPEVMAESRTVTRRLVRCGDGREATPAWHDRRRSVHDPRVAPVAAAPQADALIVRIVRIVDHWCTVRDDGRLRFTARRTSASAVSEWG